MPADDDGATHSEAGVRKPPMEETAGGVARWRVRRYGDLTAVMPDCEHNLCDMARTLRMGENTFRRPCNWPDADSRILVFRTPAAPRCGRPPWVDLDALDREGLFEASRFALFTRRTSD